MADRTTAGRDRGAGTPATASRPNTSPLAIRQPARPGYTLLLWSTLAASLLSLDPVFRGIAWWLLPTFGSALVFAAAATARALRLPSLVASLVGLVVGGIVCSLATNDGTAILGVVPTGATVEHARLLAAQAQEAIVAEQAPVVVGDALLAVVLVSVVAASVLIDVLARVAKLPALTGVVFAVVIVVPSLIPDLQPSWVWVVATVLGFLGILLASSGRRPSRASLVAGLVGVVVAGVVTALLPVTLASPLTGVGTGTGISTGVNPVINLGKDLRRGSPVTVLTYSTTASEGQYLKLVDLVDFSGTTWSPASVRLDSSNDVDDLPAAAGISSSVRRSTVTSKIDVSLLRSPYLPIPVPATKITGVGDAWKYVDQSGVTIRSTTQGSQGLDYTVVSRPVNPTTEQIVQSLGSQSADMSDYLDVDGVPASITRLAKRVTADTANSFDAAVALQDYFRNGTFTYSEDTPVREGYDGSGLDMVETFLQRKSGYCVHFASAMAVMARTLGIPSRIAVGFLPGTQVGGGDSWTVSSNDLHTWPELYFQGLGWIPFEPTVGQGTTQSYLTQTGTEATPSASASTSPTDEATASASTTESAAATETATAGADTASASAEAAAAGGGVGALPAGIAGGLAVIVLAALPWWLRTSRRRRRLTAGPPDRALQAWIEVVDTARDLGIPVEPGATPQQTATALGDRAPTIGVLTAALEAERFAGGGRSAGTPAPEAARTVIAELRRSAPGLARVRATVVPASLFVQQRPQGAVGA